MRAVVLMGVAACSGDDGGSDGVDARASASHVLYLNRGGGTYTVGPSDSVANTQEFSSSTVTAPAFPGTDDQWAAARDCVATLYAPYDVDVVDVDPGAVDHVEIVVTTLPSVFGLPNGVSSAAPATCEDRPRGLGVTFGQFFLSEPRGLCEAIAYTAGNTYGLDWVLECSDVMTYLVGCGDKTFQDIDAMCGETDPRPCRCVGTTQNSHQFLATKLGLR